MEAVFFLMLFLGEVCLCERVYVPSVFRDLLERINNKRVKQSQRLAVCFIVKFLPYVFVPAGRSCFWLPKLIGLIVHPVNQKMQIGDHQCVIIGQFCDFFFFHFWWDFYLHVYGQRRAVEFHRYLAVHDSPVALASLMAPSQDIIQHRLHSINVLSSMCCSPGLGFYMQHTKMSLIFRGFSGIHICYSFNWVTITSLLDSSWCDMV